MTWTTGAQAAAAVSGVGRFPISPLCKQVDCFRVAFNGINPTAVLITSGLPVIRPQTARITPPFATRQERSPRTPYFGTSKTRATKVRDACTAAVGLNPELNGHARDATVRAVIFEIPW